MYNPRDEQEALEHFKRKIGQIVGALLAHLSKRHPRKYGLLRHKTVNPKMLKNVEWFEAVLPTITYGPLLELVEKLYGVVASGLDTYAPLPEIILSEGFGPSVSGVEPRRAPVLAFSKEEMAGLMEARKKLVEQYKSKKTKREKEGKENAKSD